MGIESAAQAVSAASVAQQVGANNIANVNTDEFKASSVAFEEGPGGNGVRVSDIRRDDSPGPVINGVEGSNTDIGREMVGLMRNEHMVGANAAVVRAHEEMTGHLLNMVV
ncbi:flagellar basal body protein [Salidesulfovibrio brasiliensis]|uniref:flagellar basal body protein n=1 Tax=Salidesulfovibrio brasiliensis TaxID=221711 RepID=UPI0006D02CFF|nr:flagellar basal body rod C-terminal domain-containing protein [Salidesulfovibrio brasiliensis]